uniref:Lipoprotein n=1 Tax=Clastoptera arizonana TaxID=38151 RepID=A0A1B6DMZ7_9HEMI
MIKITIIFVVITLVCACDPNEQKLLEDFLKIYEAEIDLIFSTQKKHKKDPVETTVMNSLSSEILEYECQMLAILKTVFEFRNDLENPIYVKTIKFLQKIDDYKNFRNFGVTSRQSQLLQLTDEVVFFRLEIDIVKLFKDCKLPENFAQDNVLKFLTSKL